MSYNAISMKKINKADAVALRDELVSVGWSFREEHHFMDKLLAKFPNMRRWMYKRLILLARLKKLNPGMLDEPIEKQVMI